MISGAEFGMPPSEGRGHIACHPKRMASPRPVPAEMRAWFPFLFPDTQNCKITLLEQKSRKHCDEVIDHLTFVKEVIFEAIQYLSTRKFVAMTTSWVTGPATPKQAAAIPFCLSGNRRDILQPLYFLLKKFFPIRGESDLWSFKKSKASVCPTYIPARTTSDFLVFLLFFHSDMPALCKVEIIIAYNYLWYVNITVSLREISLKIYFNPPTSLY